MYFLLSGGSVFRRRHIVDHEEFAAAVFTHVLADLHGIELTLARDRDIFSAVRTCEHDALSYRALQCSSLLAQVSEIAANCCYTIVPFAIFGPCPPWYGFPVSKTICWPNGWSLPRHARPQF
jgi:hypothetical protein